MLYYMFYSIISWQVLRSLVAVAVMTECSCCLVPGETGVPRWRGRVSVSPNLSSVSQTGHHSDKHRHRQLCPNTTNCSLFKFKWFIHVWRKGQGSLNTWTLCCECAKINIYVDFPYLQNSNVWTFLVSYYLCQKYRGEDSAQLWAEMKLQHQPQQPRLLHHCQISIFIWCFGILQKIEILKFCNLNVFMVLYYTA